MSHLVHVFSISFLAIPVEGKGTLKQRWTKSFMKRHWLTCHVPDRYPLGSLIKVYMAWNWHFHPTIMPHKKHWTERLLPYTSAAPSRTFICSPHASRLLRDPLFSQFVLKINVSYLEHVEGSWRETSSKGSTDGSPVVSTKLVGYLWDTNKSGAPSSPFSLSCNINV